MITVKIEGMQSTLAHLNGMSKQVRYAASRALTSVAYKANTEIKEEMKRTFKGGVTPWVQRSFKVEKATKENLTATVSLRDDQNYGKTLRHLFTGGTRQWKALEGWLRARRLVPEGMMIVPGDAIALDSRGNILRSRLKELLGVLGSSVRNLRVYYDRNVSRNEGGKELGFFVVMPGSPAAKHLHPGIWRRVEHGSYRSHVQPYIMYVTKGQWRKFIALQQIGERVVRKNWYGEFYHEFSKAMENAR